jgi:imidazoleglycerol-phosphate dehydratase
MRKANRRRVTKETQIEASLNLDGSSDVSIKTPVAFFNHMLEAMSFYAGFDLKLQASGDVEIDDHHTVEDVGIILGTLFKEALGDKVGIKRFSSNDTPMDEALVRSVIDISNRPYLVFDARFNREKIGGLSLENVKEFFYAFAMEARITLHISVLYGANDHHKVEAIFKSVGRALKEAVCIESDKVVSTKGVL